MLKKLNEKIKNFEYLYLIAAFFIPLLIMWIIHLCMGVWPFGNNSVLVLDLNGQYVYFFEDLRRKLLEGGSLLYTWSRGMGGEFMGMFAYYLSSPLSFLVVLFSEDHITEFLLMLFLVKTGLCGGTMAYYLHQIDRDNKFHILTFSTCYALSAYVVVYIHNIMWMDNLVLLPLLVLGIEKLIRERKFKLFVFSLSMCLLTSFYIGYMACLFVFLYFFYYYFTHTDRAENNLYLESCHFWKSLARIAVYSVIAVMIAMVIVYPAYTSLQFGKSTFSKPNFSFEFFHDWINIFTKLYPGTYDTVRPEGLPLLYCGTAALILLPIYFCSKGIGTKEKVGTGILMAFLLFCMNCRTLDMVWHGFQRPNWLNNRYSYMFIFLMVVCAFKALRNLPKLSYSFVIFSAIVFGISLLFFQTLEDEYIDDLKTILFGIGCIIAFALILFFASRSKYRGASLVLLFATCAELLVNGIFCTVGLDKDVVISSRTSYNSFFEKVRPLSDYILESDPYPFYRVEKTMHRKSNDIMTLGIYGLSNSSSTLNRKQIDFQNRLGYAAKSHWSKYIGGTPVSDSLLGIRYLMTNKAYTSYLYDLIKTDEVNKYYAYHNPYALSLLSAVDDDLKEVDLESFLSPLDRMNAMITAMLGKDETVRIFVPITPESTELTNITQTYIAEHNKYVLEDETKKSGKIVTTLDVPANAEVFCYFPSKYTCSKVKLSASNGSYNSTYFDSETHRVVSLGSLENGGALTVTMTLEREAEGETATRVYMAEGVDQFFYIDYDAFREAFTDIAQGGFNITEFEEDRILADVTVPEGRNTVYATIPYDAGWIVTVDGNEVETYETLNALLAFDLTDGEHEVELVYRPKCIVYGRLISIAGLVLFALAIVLDALTRRHRNRVFARMGGGHLPEKENETDNAMITEGSDGKTKENNEQTE